MDSRKKTLNAFTAVIIMITVAVLCGVGYMVYQSRGDKEHQEWMNAQNKLLDQEIEKIAQLEIDDKIYCEKGYGDVEALIKKDFHYIIDNMQDIKKKNEEFSIYPFLQRGNIINDGPEFTASFQYIDETLTYNSDMLADITNYINKESIKERSDSSSLSDEYKKIYEEKMGQIDFASVNKSLNDSYKITSTTIDNLKNVLQFLKDNQGKWQMGTTLIEFQDAALVSEYNRLTQLACPTCTIE